MKRLTLLIALLTLTVLSPFGGKNTASEYKNKQIAEKNLNILKLDSVQRIQLYADSVSLSIGVPPKLVREIAENESGWRCIRSLSGGSDYGDMQIIKPTFNYWYKNLELTGGGTRENYLVVGIHCLKFFHVKHKSWKKARFAYARGRWRERSTWTKLEKRFMDKIDWREYDGK